MNSIPTGGRTALVVAAEDSRQTAPVIVDVSRNLPIERPEQVGAALAGLSAALVSAVEGADDVSLEIDATTTGIRYRFRSYRRSTGR
ncbi:MULTISPECIES: hypothetical protein [unclassified Mesorhizobium]|uniref:hypothetical protein n=1 Tax=unclassified Mesorhizobium TaxID=325217 RepID=UPI003339CFBE